MLEATNCAKPCASAAEDAAAAAGLRFVSDEETGLRRRRKGGSFVYLSAAGRPIKERATLARIRKLAIPPAWSDVWICRSDVGHLQATGRDARGRKQYRYHPEWHRVRDETKYDRLASFAQALPRMRKAVDRHLRGQGLGREKVLATVVRLLETTLIRVGNREYARANKSYGLTTLQDRHVQFNGSAVKFKFRAKTGKEWRLKVTDRRIARIVRSCQDLPGQHLFQYEDETGEIRQVSSTDVNAYLREIAGIDVTAKDFRTWAGTVLAATALGEFERVDSEAAAKRNIKQAIELVAAQLGNTTTICRKCSVHPKVLEFYLDGSLAGRLKRKVPKKRRRELAELQPEEAATLVLLQASSGGSC
jgi:DNA topoisomerase-1